MILPDFNRDEILTHLANRYASIDVGLGDWSNVNMQDYYDYVYNMYEQTKNNDALTNAQQEFVNDLMTQQKIDYGNDIKPDGEYDKRMTFPDVDEFNKFLDSKPDYIDLLDNGIYEYVINEFGEVEFYNRINS